VNIFFPEKRFGAQKAGKPWKRKMLVPQTSFGPNFQTKAILTRFFLPIFAVL